jgi:hypothetical protein
LIQRAISLEGDCGLLIGTVGLDDFRIPESKPVAVSARVNPFELTGPITEPYNNIVRVETIGPDQIRCTVVVYVLSEKRSTICAIGIEVKKRSLAGAAKQDSDAPVQA